MKLMRNARVKPPNAPKPLLRSPAGHRRYGAGGSRSPSSFGPVARGGNRPPPKAIILQLNSLTIFREISYYSSAVQQYPATQRIAVAQVFFLFFETRI